MYKHLTDKFLRITISLLLAHMLLSGTAQTRLPKLVSNGMVLQREVPLTIWGWDSPGQEVTISFKGTDYRCTTDASGNWSLEMAALATGGPYEMKVKGSSEVILDDILIGDVWLCSGQSNMELPVSRVKPRYPQEIAAANNSLIRQFEVPDKYNFKEPQTDFTGGQWTACTPETVQRFSAVGYFFADTLFKKYGVPIGIINSALGGSPIQSWMSQEALQAYPHYLDEMRKFKDDALIAQISKADNDRSNEWYGRSTRKDEGLRANPQWKVAGLDDRKWPTMNVPGYWADEPLGQKNGVVWFRKTVTLNEAWTNGVAELELGRVVDADSVFVNGVFVGRTTYQYPPRIYQIPAGVLHAGANDIVIRVINNMGRGGFVLDKKYELRQVDRVLDLTGAWKYRLGAEMEPLQGPTFIRWKSGGLYNAMIAPLLNYPIKGALWYQGESNAGDGAEEYRELLPDLIEDWREHWQIGQFPFLFVQLANFMNPTDDPNQPSSWAVLRESQQLSLSTPNTAMAVISDIGEWNDVHPLNKKDVGQRLALAAMKRAYNETLVFSGPVLKSSNVKGKKVILSFDHVGSGLVSKGSKLQGFALAGADETYYWADAKIKKDRVILSCKEVNKPAKVKYAWADNPDKANLYNKEGLPASAFRAEVQ